MHLQCGNPCIECAPSIGGGRGPVDPANPFVNLSSEAPDFDAFIGRRYGSGGDEPPLGDLFYAVGCLGWCISSISQADADICALNQEVLCLSVNWPEHPGNPPVHPPDDNPPPDNPPNPRPIFWNNAQSCNFTCPDGTEFTFTVPAHTFSSLYNQATVDALAHSYACNQAAIQRLCVGDLTPDITCSEAFYDGTINVSSVNQPITFTTSAPLPPGLSLIPSTSGDSVFVSGIPTLPGDYVIGLEVTDSEGHMVQKNFNLTVFGITTPASLPPATEGTPYSVAIETEGTVTGSVTFRFAGVLPTGMTFNNATGIISGTPDTGTNGEYNFTITARARGVACPKDFFMTVEEATTCPDWANDLIFGVPFVSPGITFTPGAGPSNTFSFQGVGDPFNLLEGTNTGSFVYNGPGCDCVVHGEVVIRTGDFSRQNSQVMFTSSVIGVFFIADLNLAAGVYDFPFSLPDTLGVPHTITVNVYGSLDQLFAGQAEWNGYIDNLP